MRQRIYPGILFALLLCCLCQAALAEGLAFDNVPHVLRPGKYYDIVIQSPAAGTASLTLVDKADQLVYTIYDGYPLLSGDNALTWDGMRMDHTLIDPGEYVLRLETGEGSRVNSDLRIGSPYPLLTDISQNGSLVREDTPVEVAYRASEEGTLQVQLTSYITGQTELLTSAPVQAGMNSFVWDGTYAGAQVLAGEYALVMTLASASGSESMPQHVFVTVQWVAQAVPSVVVEITLPPEGSQAQEAADDAPSILVQPDVTPTPLISPPYSNANDGTYWSMTPGELDDAVIWDILTQPIVVYDDGKIKGNEHVYLMENPDGTGAQIAQIHGKSQGLHLLGEVNEHGYVLAEAFSNYDPEYQPTTDEEREHAFDVKQGYIKASGLKTVEVKQDIAFVIDKLTQRMYMFKDGVRVTEFLIATGKIADNKYYNETINGEFITISHVGGFWSGNMYCDMAIRINGGILLHEVPHKVNADGTKNYSSFEAYLGTKQSHGCVRIQRLKNPEGYNARWLWENLDRKGGYKVIIWDDLNRYDSPTTWQENPKN